MRSLATQREKAHKSALAQGYEFKLWSGLGYGFKTASQLEEWIQIPIYLAMSFRFRFTNKADDSSAYASIPIHLDGGIAQVSILRNRKGFMHPAKDTDLRQYVEGTFVVEPYSKEALIHWV